LPIAAAYDSNSNAMVVQMNATGSFPLTETRYGLAVSWDVDRSGGVDIDMQAVIIDNRGQVVDAVYYNNLKAMKAAVTHSGDETTGEKEGYDEIIWVTLPKLHESVQLIVFVIAAYKGGHLKDAKSGKFHVLENSKDKEVARFDLEKSEEEVDAVAVLVRSGGSWHLRMLEEPAQDGKHFVDILEPTIGNIVRREIPGAPKRLKVAFAMEKGSVVDLPATSSIKSVTAGLGWDTGKGNIDLDVSVVLFDSHGKQKETWRASVSSTAATISPAREAVTTRPSRSTSRYYPRRSSSWCSW